jgi:hypothetical protein
MKLTCFLVILLTIFTGCSTIPFPECNNTYAPDSKLLQIATKYNVCLRDVGNGIIVANGIAIGVGAYTVEKAIKEVNNTIKFLNTDITELAFQAFAVERLRQFPGLIEVSAIYLPEFDSIRPMDKESKVIIQTFLRGEVLPMLERYRIQ